MLIPFYCIISIPHFGTVLNWAMSISKSSVLLTVFLYYNCCSGFFKHWVGGRVNCSTATNYLRKISSIIQLGIRLCSVLLCVLKFFYFVCNFTLRYLPHLSFIDHFILWVLRPVHFFLIYFLYLFINVWHYKNSHDCT